MLTGRVLGLDEARGLPTVIGRTVRRMGEPVIRGALRRGMRLLARQFVIGRTMQEALARAGSAEGRRWRYSFDMLGEAATHRGRCRALPRRLSRRDRCRPGASGGGPVAGPGISVKLSALHPRYEPLQAPRCVPGADRIAGRARAGRAGGRHRPHRRCRGGRATGNKPRHFRSRAGRSGAGRLGRAWACRAGLPEAHAAAARLGRRAGPPHRACRAGAAGQGRLLGHRDQAGTGARPRRLSGVHPQGRDRRLLDRLRAADAGASRRHPAGVRHPQRAEPRNHPRTRGRRAVRDAAPARDGRGALFRRGRPRLPGARLCAGRQPRGPAGLSGAAAAGERRQHQLRPSPGRSGGAGGGDRRRSRRPAARAGQRAQPAHSAAGRPLSRPRQFRRPRSRRPGGRHRRRWPRSGARAGSTCRAAARGGNCATRPTTARVAGSAPDATAGGNRRGAGAARARLAGVGRGGRRAPRRMCWTVPPR